MLYISFNVNVFKWNSYLFRTGEREARYTQYIDILSLNFELIKLGGVYDFPLRCYVPG